MNRKAKSCLAKVLVTLSAGVMGAGWLLAADNTDNIVRLEGRCLRDDRGPFLGLGASYFQALRDARFQPERLDSNLRLLAANGFNYVRVLSMVSWDELEIAPVTFTNRQGRVITLWPDYWARLGQLMDTAWRHGLRTELTLFADAQYVMPTKDQRRAHAAAVLEHLRGREHQLMYLEVANEAWQNGFAGSQGVSDLRELAAFLAGGTKMLVAITSNDDTSDAGIISLYAGSAADLATVHFSRDIRGPQGAWLPIIDSYRAALLPGVPPVSSNEPIGPGSSVNAEADPIRLCSAAAFAYIAGLPAYVFHSRAGIYGFQRCCPPSGDEVRFESTPGIDVYRVLRRVLPADVPNWKRNDGLEADAPFTVFCKGQPNRYWADVAGAKDGCVRNIGAVRERDFVCLPMGILEEGLRLQARRDVAVTAIHLLTGATVTNLTLGKGAEFLLPKGPGAYVLKGRYGTSGS